MVWPHERSTFEEEKKWREKAIFPVLQKLTHMGHTEKVKRPYARSWGPDGPQTSSLLIIAFLWANIFHNYTIADVYALVAQNTQLCDLTKLW